MKRILPILILPLLAMVFFACSDDMQKELTDDQYVRVEFSECTGCEKCVDNFTCPEGAIYIDERTGMAAIDADKCVSCMKCIDVFHCPDNAFTTIADNIPPATIEDLAAVSDTVGALTVTFTAPGDDGQEGMAFRYAVSITDPEGEALVSNWSPLPALGGMTEVWNFCGLPEDVTATVRVQAFDEVNNHNALTQQSVMITGVIVDSLAPAVIDDLIAEAGESDIVLTWTAPGDDGDEGSAASYDLRYSTAAIDESNWSDATEIAGVPTPAAAGTQQSLTLTDIPQLTELYFSIRATDENDNTAAPSANATAATTGDITAPGEISDLAAGSASATTILAQWTATGDNGDEGAASAYVIKISTNEITEANWDDLDDWPNTMTPQSAGAAESFVFTGLDSLTTFHFAVKAIDDAGNSSPLSNTAQATTEGEIDTTPPAAITNLTVTENRADLTLNWSAPGDDGDTGQATSYDIRKSNEPITDANWDDAEALPSPPTPSMAGSTEYYFATVESGLTWYFAIKATDDVNNQSGLSNVAMITLEEDTTPPAAITDLAVFEGQTSNSRITIEWTAPGDDGNTGTADHYEVKYSMQPITEANWDMCNSVVSPPDPGAAGDDESCDVTLLQNGVIYYFGVKAVDENGNAGDISNIASGKIVYHILTSCHDCNNCINRCPNGAIYDAGSIKQIDPDDCDACGNCVPYCPWNAIRLWAMGY